MKTQTELSLLNYNRQPVSAFTNFFNGVEAEIKSGISLPNIFSKTLTQFKKILEPEPILTEDEKADLENPERHGENALVYNEEFLPIAVSKDKNNRPSNIVEFDYSLSKSYLPTALNDPENYGALKTEFANAIKNSDNIQDFHEFSTKSALETFKRKLRV